MFYGRIKNC